MKVSSMSKGKLLIVQLCFFLRVSLVYRDSFIFEYTFSSINLVQKFTGNQAHNALSSCRAIFKAKMQGLEEMKFQFFSEPLDRCLLLRNDSTSQKRSSKL